MKASTHASGVGVDAAAVECDCAEHYVDATSVLPNKGSTSVKASTPSGRWGGAWWRVRCEHILSTEDRVRVARNKRKGHFNGAMEGA